MTNNAPAVWSSSNQKSSSFSGYKATSNSALDDFGRTTVTEFKKDRLAAEITTAEMDLAIARKDHFARKTDSGAKARFHAAQSRVDELRSQLRK